MAESGGFAVAVLRTQATWRRLTKNVLIGSVLQPARKRVIQNRLKIPQITVGALDRGIVAFQPSAIDQDFARPVARKPFEMSDGRVAVFAIDRVIMMLRPGRDLMLQLGVEPAPSEIGKIED